MAGRDRNLKKLANGRWQVRIVCGGRRVKRTFPTRELARQFRDAVIQDRQLRKVGLPGILRHAPAVMEVMEDYLSDLHARGCAAGTQALYGSIFKAWRCFLVDSGWAELRASEVDMRVVGEFIRWRRSNSLVPSRTSPVRDPTIVMNIKALATAMRAAGLEVGFKVPRNLRRDLGGKRLLTVSEIRSFLAAMPEASLERTYAEVAFNTGMRGSDIRALRWHQINFEERHLSFRTRKTRKDQTIPLTDSAAHHLLAWRRCQKVVRLDGLVFHRDGKPLRPNSLRRRFYKASESAGLEPPVGYLGLARNAVIAYLVEQGENVFLVSQLVGHANLQTTMKYIQRLQMEVGKLRPLAARLDEIQKS